MDSESYSVLKECCQTFSSFKENKWKEERKERKEIDPIESLRLLTEHESNFNTTIKSTFLRVPDKEAQRDGKRIVKCFCGETAMKFKLCPKHYFDAFWDIEQQYLNIKIIPTEKSAEIEQYPDTLFSPVNFAEVEDG